VQPEPGQSFRRLQSLADQASRSKRQ